MLRTTLDDKLEQLEKEIQSKTGAQYQTIKSIREEKDEKFAEKIYNFSKQLKPAQLQDLLLYTFQEAQRDVALLNYPQHPGDSFCVILYKVYFGKISNGSRQLFSNPDQTLFELQKIIFQNLKKLYPEESDYSLVYLAIDASSNPNKGLRTGLSQNDRAAAISRLQIEYHIPTMADGVDQLMPRSHNHSTPPTSVKETEPDLIGEILEQLRKENKPTAAELSDEEIDKRTRDLYTNVIEKQNLTEDKIIKEAEELRNSICTKMYTYKPSEPWFGTRALAKFNFAQEVRKSQPKNPWGKKILNWSQVKNFLELCDDMLTRNKKYHSDKEVLANILRGKKTKTDDDRLADLREKFELLDYVRPKEDIQQENGVSQHAHPM